MDDHNDEHDRGLAYDINTLMTRRRALTLLAGFGLVSLVGCSTKDASSVTSTTSTTTAASDAAAGCSTIPKETAGPYPGDGTNGPNVLTESGIVRSDIRSSFGGASSTAAGVPLTIELTIQDTKNSCKALAGAAVYLWHCDINGKYSMYSQGVTSENYLRGVQETDADGRVTFKSIFPAAYSGRWPHIHFEVYPTIAEATAAGTPRATSQVALPEDICDTVYATDGYAQSVRNMSQSSLATDNVFRDDKGVRQLATVTGSVKEGYLAKLDVPI